MVQVRLVGIALDLSSQPVILLKPMAEQPGSGRIVPIWIGSQEAASILVALDGDSAPRPLSHDLMTSILEVAGIELQRVDVTRIDEGTFYAELSLHTPAGPVVLDSRPSDAIALAVRADADIWVADEVIESVGIVDESKIELADDDGDGDDDKVAEFKRFIDEVEPEDFQG